MKMTRTATSAGGQVLMPSLAYPYSTVNLNVRGHSKFFKQAILAQILDIVRSTFCSMRILGMVVLVLQTL